MKTFRCWQEAGRPEDGLDVRAHFPREAAEDYAKKCDADSGGEYNDAFVVFVRDPKGVTHLFNVEPEVEKRFHAWKQEPSSETKQGIEP